MAVADKIVALLDTMTVASLDALSPVRRRQFADMCRHWAAIADRPKALLSARPRAPASGPDMAESLSVSPLGDLASERLQAKSPIGDA